ncbi:MAG TPA: DedA family protein [Candidatus Angelobacter sp.]|jgi:membrane-associated protein|nr:DedA family protein [Candidatus Angelobacter sp.]
MDIKVEQSVAADGGEPGRGPDGAEPEGEPHGVTIRRADVFCLGPLILLTVYGLVMLPIAPSLLGPHPVLLSAIYGSSSSMIASGAAARGGNAALWLVCVAPIVILLIRDPFLYWAGRRYGRRIVEYLAEQDPRWHRRMARSERWFQRWGAWAIAFGYYIPFVPATLFYLAAGESRMRIRTFVIADLAGTLTWIGIHVGTGYAIGKPATDLANTISHYGLWAALAIIGVAVGWSIFNNVRQQRAVA